MKKFHWCLRLDVSKTGHKLRVVA